jgi:hypothetical protein
MQVHDDPVSGPSVQLVHTTPSVVKLDIPDQAIREASRFLRNINLDDPDDQILSDVWFYVYGKLSQYPTISGSIANEDEFHANVKRKGEKEILELVKDSASRNSWLDLIHNGIFSSLMTSSSFHVIYSDVFVKKNSADPSKSGRISLSEPLAEGSHKLESTRFIFDQVL